MQIGKRSDRIAARRVAPHLRISDARYTRDLRRYQLAWRLIRHEARSRTVERWSGLSMYRIRTLYRAYAGGGGLQPPQSPLRGVAPYQISFFFRSAQVKCETAVLAGFLHAFEIFPSDAAQGGVEHLASVARGERLCRAYEEFAAYRPESLITLEHAILLLHELTRDVEIGLTSCENCRILIVVDRLAIGPPRCAYCAYEEHAGLPFAFRGNHHAC